MGDVCCKHAVERVFSATPIVEICSYACVLLVSFSSKWVCMSVFGGIALHVALLTAKQRGSTKFDPFF